MKGSRVLSALLCMVLLILLFPVTASADMGPKASVHISFENMGEAVCYGTLLSSAESTGPYSAWNGNEKESNNYGSNEDIWRAFVEYKDEDGFYFLGISWEVSESHSIDWTYYPPSTFKILLYYPETDTFAVSGVYERYAFDAYYTVDMNNAGEDITAQKSYEYRDELLSLVARILLTIAIEMGVALLFGFRGRRELLLLVGVNGATQIILNVLLNIVNYRSGWMIFCACYVV